MNLDNLPSIADVPRDITCHRLKKASVIGHLSVCNTVMGPLNLVLVTIVSSINLGTKRS